MHPLDSPVKGALGWQPFENTPCFAGFALGSAQLWLAFLPIPLPGVSSGSLHEERGAIPAHPVQARPREPHIWFWGRRVDWAVLCGSSLPARILLAGGTLGGRGAYRSDGQPHLQVAEHNDAERNEATCDHENDHVRLHPRVGAATEHIGATGSLQAVGPVPAEKGQKPLLKWAGTRILAPAPQ